LKDQLNNVELRVQMLKVPGGQYGSWRKHSMIHTFRCPNRLEIAGWRFSKLFGLILWKPLGGSWALRINGKKLDEGTYQYSLHQKFSFFLIKMVMLSSGFENQPRQLLRIRRIGLIPNREWRGWRGPCPFFFYFICSQILNNHWILFPVFNHSSSIGNWRWSQDLWVYHSVGRLHNSHSR
jgi:hypothetical protein